MKHFIVVMLAVLSVSVLSGCNTVNGAGKDIQAGGRAISRAAS